MTCPRDCLLKGTETASCSLQHCSRKPDSKEKGSGSLGGGPELRPLLGQAGSERSEAGQRANSRRRAIASPWDLGQVSGLSCFSLS